MTYLVAVFRSIEEMKKGQVWAITLVDAPTEMVAAMKLPGYMGRNLLNKFVAFNAVPEHFLPHVAAIRRGAPIESREDKAIIDFVIEEVGESFKDGKRVTH